jgi:uncharacterized cupredoxin-like copper-binding protein
MKKAAVALALLLASLALVACGGSSSDSGSTEAKPENGTAAESGGNAGEEGGGGEGSSGGGGTVSFEADPGGNIAFTTTSASSEAGEVTIDFNNPQSVPHDVAIENEKGEVIGETELVSEDSSSTTVELKPGKKYTFFCTVPGHREAGMEGTLTTK